MEVVKAGCSGLEPGLWGELDWGRFGRGEEWQERRPERKGNKAQRERK